MNRFITSFVAVLGGLMLWAAWPTSPLTVLVFIAWLPLLWVEENTHSWKKFFGLAYVHMLIWNVAVTWWVANSSVPGALGAFFANSLVMCVPWLLYRTTRRKFGNWIGYGSLIVFWLAFEYIHHNWELSWPWLTLGNAFATHPEWVQWYEYCGTTGGSLWILLVNLILYSLIREYRAFGRTRAYYVGAIIISLLLIGPVIWSKNLLDSEKKIMQASLFETTRNVVVVQPNIDPWAEKFAGDIKSQVEKLIVLSEEKIDRNTTLVVWPETAVPAQVWEDEIKQDQFYQPIWSFLDRHPFVNLLTGIDSYKNYGSNKDSATKTARHDKESNLYYDAFNTAAFFDADTNIQLYHKAKLVPGVESLPSFLKFMGKSFESFGGISGTLGRDNERKVFIPWDNYYKSAPIICYESIYSEYVTGYVKKGANLLTIITNDGWWKNTQGYRQHMNYGRLRAIETRKWVARSANTGISCFIDPLGNVIQPQPWNVSGSIKLAIPVDNRMTFFVRHGDIISTAMLFVSGLLILLNLVYWFRKRFDVKKKSGQPVNLS